MTRRIAIIGASYRFPGAAGAADFDAALQAERDLVTQVAEDRWDPEVFQHPDRQHPGTSVTFAAGSLGDISGFDAPFFGISPREAAQMDPQQRLLLELSWEAMEDAGIAPETLRGSQCGVYLGVASLDYAYRLSEDLSALDTSSATGNTSSIASNRISYLFDLRGPSLSLDTACSSAMVAFHQACQAIRSGETDMALTGGVSLHLHPFGFIIFSRAGMLSANGRCRAFDADGDGYVRSEGAGIFMLKEYEQARADGDHILAVVAASGSNTDGHKQGLTVPNHEAQRQLMSDTLARAGLSADDIDYLEAHGTGTSVGDPIEVRAIGEALGRQRKAPLPIGSVKSNLGHLETASGVAGIAKALHVIAQRTIPATIGIKTLNPRLESELNGIRVVTAPQPLRQQGRLVVGVNSFGFGGANAHVILESPPAAPEQEAPAHPQESADAAVPLRLTARDPQALRALAGRLADYLERRDTPLPELASSLWYRREHMRYGALLWADDRQQARQQLTALAADSEQGLPVYGERLAAKPPGAVFVYSGNGCQWHCMGRALLESSTLFAEAIDDVDRLFARHGDFSLREELEGSNGDRLAQTEIAQPTLFAVQVGLTRLLEARGIMPAAVAGHSVGEVAAAWASGALTLEQAVRVIYFRSHHQGLTRGQGGMMAAALGEQEARQRLADTRLDRVVLAGVNSAAGVTLAGCTEQLRLLEAELSEARVFARLLPLDYAFHSPMMDPIREGLLRDLAELEPTATATCAMISTVSGEPIAGEKLDAGYWWDNIRQPVRFHGATEHLLEAGHRLFIEIGAHPILRRYLTDTLSEKQRSGLVVETLKRPGDSEPADAQQRSAVEKTIAECWLSGLELPAERWLAAPARHLDLPHYPWQREHYWYRATGNAMGRIDRHVEHPLLGYRLSGHERCWESQLDTQRLPWLADHNVGDSVIFPGAGFAELTLAAALSWREQTLIDIEALEIRSPLLLDAPHGKQVRLNIRTADGAVDIHSRDSASTDDWHLNARARILQQSLGLSLERQAPAIPPRPADFDHDSHLARAAAIGLHYGPAFAAVTRGWVEADDTVIAELDGDATVRNGQTHCLLAPGLLDSAFQLFIPLLAGDSSQHGEPSGSASPLAFVPVRLERLQLRLQDAPPVLARIKLTSRAPHSLCADIELFDAEGRAVAVVQAARFRAVRLRHQAQQPLDYLAHRLVASPRHAPGRMLDSTTLSDTLGNAFRQATGSRYAGEIAPLLDAMTEAFTLEAVNSQSTDAARAGEESRATGLARQLGLLDEHQLEARASLQPAEAGGAEIWRLLLNDYPDAAELILPLGRAGYRLGRPHNEEAQPVGATDAALLQAAPGDSGWQALADALVQQLDALLNELPAGARLRVLEVSRLRPQWLPRLNIGGHAERLEYHLAAMGDEARTSGEAMVESGQRLTLHDADSLPPAGLDVSLVLLSSDLPIERLQTLLASLADQLAPNALILRVGPGEADWQQLALQHCAPGERPATRPQLSRVLSDLHYRDVSSHGLEDAASGIELLTARAPQRPSHAAPGKADAVASSWLLVSDALRNPLADAIATRLEAHGERAVVCMDDAIGTLLAHAPHANRIIDLRGMGERPTLRCQLAAHWLNALDGDAREGELWLLTRGVAATLDSPPSGFSAPAGEVAEDAALWGFGRTLQNEAGQRPVRLLDLPLQQRDDDSLLDALVQELTAPDSETEIVLDSAGQRFVPRIAAHLAPQPPNPRVSARQALTLGFELPGQLRHLQWQPHELAEPAAGELAIDVEATGLNFRDVMYALGMLSDEAVEEGFAGPSLGLEFAGRVAAVGPGVTAYNPGDAVVGFGPASFSTRLIASEHSLAPVPGGISAAAAATLPTTFFTVYYALKHLARLQPGERLLIHGAAGGVGLAAIQIGRWLGAEIYATAGSDEKRDTLRLLGIERIYNSRALTFAEEILAETPDGRGVDVVLNSLAGEAINQNLRVLEPFGRFLELGKRDFYDNTHIGLRPFRNNLSYFGIDSDQLMKLNPALTQTLFTDMMALFEQGELTPLPWTAFPAERVVDAFRYMQQARQIGKIVVTYPRPPQPATPPARQLAPLQLDSRAAWLVTGGLSGLGLATARWLASRGARRLVLVGRSGASRDEAREGVAALVEAGVDVRVEACDISDRDALGKVLARQRASGFPLRGVFHAAAVIDDGLIRSLDDQRIEQGMTAKLEGARHLDALTAEDPLDYFVLFSSATTLFGNPGQASYVAANHWLEGLATARRQRGQPATCIGWGPIEDVGFLARHTQTRDSLTQRLGGRTLTAAEVMGVLERLLICNAGQYGVMALDWPAIARFLPGAGAPRYLDLARTADDAAAEGDDDDLRQRLITLPEAEQRELLLEVLRHELAGILMLEAGSVDIERPVSDMGFDSLMGVELVTALESRLGIQVPVMVLNDTATLTGLADYLLARLGEEDDISEADQQAQALATLASRHGVDEEINATDADTTEQTPANARHGEEGTP
ncbi:type I polyketide synthase [Kushneria aurantia]|uniref:Type I polyketide synthase n=1 Tax=Kushneria aurantia TaxID=504092 RepID=A0ABV6G4U4_9GAMM|nr:type I polyketide synthase [Kushneria aurantia]